MSDCCLPNLGCLSIPVTRTDVQGPSGQNGISPTIIVGTVTTGDPGDPVVVTNVSTNPSIAEFDFTIPQGYSGSSGEPGVDGVSRLYSNQATTSSAIINNYDTLDSYTLPANTLASDGDAISITIYARRNGNKSTACRRIVKFGGYNICQISFFQDAPWMYYPSLSSGSVYLYKLNVEIIRTSSSTIKSIVYADLDISNGQYPPKANYEGYFFASPAFDFTQTIPILAQINQNEADAIIFTSVTIDKIKKL